MAVDSTKVISPKVAAVAVVTVILSALALATATMDIEMFSFFGNWAPFWLILTTGAINAAAGYVKRDPLREQPPNGPTPASGTNTPATGL